MSCSSYDDSVGLLHSPVTKQALMINCAAGKNILQFELKPSTSGTMTASVAKVNLYVYVWKRRETRRSRRNRRKSKKSKLIKIRVFLVDDRNRKKKRIAELRKRVHSSNWHRLSLPVSLIHSLWQVIKSFVWAAALLLLLLFRFFRESWNDHSRMGENLRSQLFSCICEST